MPKLVITSFKMLVNYFKQYRYKGQAANTVPRYVIVENLEVIFFFSSTEFINLWFVQSPVLQIQRYHSSSA